MNTQFNIDSVREIAASQWGLFTSAQAVDAGLSRTQISRMVSDGRLEPMSRGVYHFATDQLPSDHDVKAAWLSISPKRLAHERVMPRPDAIVASTTAACVLGFGDFHPSPFNFATGGRRQTNRQDMHFHAWRIDDADLRWSDGIPLTSVERTCADLIRLKTDPSLVDGFLRDAALSGYEFDLDRLGALLDELSARNGRGRHEGVRFARELMKRNVASVQLERAEALASQALSMGQG